jgi:hypothetical protein
VLSQVNDLVDLSAPYGHNEGVMGVPPKVKVEAVPAARHEFSILAPSRLRRRHPDAGTTFGHETGRTGLEVRQPAGCIVDRVGGSAGRATAVVERVTNRSLPGREELIFHPVRFPGQSPKLCLRSHVNPERSNAPVDANDRANRSGGRGRGNGRERGEDKGDALHRAQYRRQQPVLLGAVRSGALKVSLKEPDVGGCCGMAPDRSALSNACLCELLLVRRHVHGIWRSQFVDVDAVPRHAHLIGG